MMRLFKLLSIIILIIMVSCKLYEHEHPLSYEELLNDNDRADNKGFSKAKPIVIIKEKREHLDENLQKGIDGELNVSEMNKHKKELEVRSEYQSSKKLIEEQESYLISKETEVNEVKKKIDTKLSEMNIICSELTKSLSELESMKIDIMKAESDFNNARSYSGNGISAMAKQALDQSIKKIKSSKDIAVALFKDRLNALELAISSAEHIKHSIEYALREAEHVRSIGYYYIGHMIHYISDTKNNLNNTESMFKEIESELYKLRDAMKHAEEDFIVLKNAHQALKSTKR